MDEWVAWGGVGWTGKLSRSIAIIAHAGAHGGGLGGGPPSGPMLKRDTERLSAHGSLEEPYASALHVLLGVAVVVQHCEAIVRAVDADDPPGVVAATVGLVGASR